MSKTTFLTSEPPVNQHPNQVLTTAALVDNLKVFQVVWSPPLALRSWGGLELKPSAPRSDDIFSDYYLLTMLLCAIQWKLLHKMPIKLYADNNAFSYLDRYDLIGIWDSYDTATCGDLEGKIDYTCFFSAGKFYAYLSESAPCLILDLDLIVWADLIPYLSNMEAGFTHWEAISPETYWYCSKNKLTLPIGYRFPRDWNWNLDAANTSVVYFSDDRLKNYYAEQAIKYMADNVVGGDFCLIKPELLFADQRLLPICADELGLLSRTKPFIDTVWIPSDGTFNRPDPELGWWHFYELDNQPLFTHIWIAKQAIEKNQKYRNYYCHTLLDLIFARRPDLEASLARIPCLEKHLRLYANRDNLDLRQYYSRNLYGSLGP